MQVLSLLSEGVRGVILEQLKGAAASEKELPAAFYRVPLRELFGKIPRAAPDIDMVACTREMYSHIALSVLKNHLLLPKWHESDIEAEMLLKEFSISRKAVWEEVEHQYSSSSRPPLRLFIKQDYARIAALTEI